MRLPDTDELVEAYFDHVDWEHERERAENTSEAVQTLSEALVDSGREVGSAEMSALYQIVRHENNYGTDEKGASIDNLGIDFDASARKSFEDCLDGPIGIIGGGRTKVNVDGHEKEATELLEALVSGDDASSVDEAIEAFGRADVDGVRTGTVSVIAYALRPTEYPLANGTPRGWIDRLFGHSVTNDIVEYPEVARTFREVRDEYGFEDDFRHLDYFFQWVDDCLAGNLSRVRLTESGGVHVVDGLSSGTDAYWVNQNNQSEIRDDYLRASVDDVWHHDLGRLDEGDFVFHNFDGGVIAVSRVASPAEEYQFRGESFYRVDVSTRFVADPLPVDESLASRLNGDELGLEKYGPFTKNDELKTAYCTNLSTEAADWLFTRLGVAPPDWDSQREGAFQVPDEPPAQHEKIARQLDATGQVVLSGPPGTGKTHTATKFARWWVGRETETPTAEQVRTVTFHPAFAYEDFLEGLTATTSDDDGDSDDTDGVDRVSYEIEPGVLREVAADAREAYRETVERPGADPGDAPPYVLVIDEINRGDLPQILGEAITLLEPGERDRHEVTLAHSGESFSLPPNLYFVGTMNTADQSIALVDAALRRRFRFLRHPPRPERVVEVEVERDDGTLEPAAVVGDQTATPRNRLLAASAVALKTLDERIRADAARLKRGQQLGHAALFGHDNPRSVTDAWQFELLPQLAEYYYGQTDALRQELFAGGDSVLFDWRRGVPADLEPELLYDALCELGGLVDDALPLHGNAEDSATEVVDGGVQTGDDTAESAGTTGDE